MNVATRHGLGSLIVLMGVLIVGAAHATGVQPPRGIIYRADVKTSFGTEFQDCFRFDDARILTIDGLGTLAFNFLDLGKARRQWQAVTTFGAGLSIGFSGIAFGNAQKGFLAADAVSEFGDTYLIQAVPDATCALAARNARSPYQK
jgi:hypothetical protein